MIKPEEMMELNKLASDNTKRLVPKAEAAIDRINRKIKEKQKNER